MNKIEFSENLASDFNQISVENSFWDYQELERLNGTLVNTVMALREVNKRLTEFSRAKTMAEYEYKTKFREAYFSVKNYSNETQRKVLAEIECHDLEAELMYYQELVDEYTRRSYALRTELDILKTLGHNIRQELRIV